MSTEKDSQPIRLNAQINLLSKRRTSAMALLGECLYEETWSKPEFRSLYKGLYDSIENLDAQIESLRAKLQDDELSSIEATTALPLTDVPEPKKACPSCGKQIADDDSRCSSCAMVATMRIRSVTLCSECGNTINDGDCFCTNCGAAAPSLNDIARPSGLLSRPDKHEKDMSGLEIVSSAFSKEGFLNQQPDMPTGLCKSCGYKGASRASFCSKCGVRL